MVWRLHKGVDNVQGRRWENCCGETVPVVIRATGERTFALCRECVYEQADAGSIRVVERVPFEAALRQSYRLGIEMGTDWLVIVDADVLLGRNAVSRLLSHTRYVGAQVLGFEPLVFDKVFGHYRSAGIKVYRVEHLTMAIKCIPREAVALRPESTVIHEMRGAGYRFESVPIVCGVHDFEQYYCDLYRKAFVHGQKFRKAVFARLPHWVHVSDNDPDFSVVVRGVMDGLTSREPASVNKRRYEGKARKALDELGIEEKRPIEDLRGGQRMVEEILAAAGPFHSSLMGRLRREIAARGVARAVQYSLGAALTGTGERLKQSASR